MKEIHNKAYITIEHKTQSYQKQPQYKANEEKFNQIRLFIYFYLWLSWARYLLSSSCHVVQNGTGVCLVSYSHLLLEAWEGWDFHCPYPLWDWSFQPFRDKQHHIVVICSRILDQQDLLKDKVTQHSTTKTSDQKMLLVVAGEIYVKEKAVIACCIILHCSLLKLTVIVILHIVPTAAS